MCAYDIFTNQAYLDRPALKALAFKSQHFTYQRPISDRALTEFQRLKHCLAQNPQPIILDSGCGRGLSSRQLAHCYPEHWIVAIDQSSCRLAALKGQLPNNLLVITANCIDFWRLLAQDDTVCIAAHYLLYPNPWPKKKQEGRRWYAHPIFPVLLSLSPWTHFRSNWLFYLQSCAAVANQFGLHTLLHKISAVNPGMTHFERKYHASHTPTLD